MSLYNSCEDNVNFLNFANTEIRIIGPDFINSPLITCLNFTNNSIVQISHDAFRKLTNLTTLFLSDNNVESEFYLSGHENLQVLVMDNYKWPYGSSEQRVLGKYQNLEILSLSRNYIENLYLDQDHLSYQSYDLMSPNLQDIPFPNLKILDLSQNQIRIAKFVTLLPNYGLTFLDLHANLLSSLKMNKKGETVKILILDDNQINYVMWQSDDSSLDLIGMKTLTYLSISNNRIKHIQSNAFIDTNRLEVLNLSRNAIETLYRHTFANLDYLKTVDLSFNKIKNIPQLSNELNISTFFLHYNVINKITPNAFIQYPMLKKLFLEGNDIEWIDTKAFAQLSMLEELNLSNNNLTSLSEGWSESLISLKYLDLSENNFISLESLSLSNTIPLTELNLIKNPLKHLNIRYFDNLPQNLTVHLLD